MSHIEFIETNCACFVSNNIKHKKIRIYCFAKHIFHIECFRNKKIRSVDA